MGKYQRILVLMAMEAEAEPARRALGLNGAARSLHPALSPVIYESNGNGGDPDLAVAVYGTDVRFGVDSIGTQTATLAAFMAMEAHRPDVVISAGTAGGFQSRGGDIGTVYLSTEPVVFHDRRIGIPGFTEYGVGSYPTAGTPEMAAAIGALPGLVTTGDSLDAPPIDMERMDASGAVAKDMEAAAVARIAEHLAIGFVALKSITDIVETDADTPEQFGRNLQRASMMLAQALPRLVATLRNTEQPPRLGTASAI